MRLGFFTLLTRCSLFYTEQDLYYYEIIPLVTKIMKYGKFTLFTEMLELLLAVNQFLTMTVGESRIRAPPPSPPNTKRLPPSMT